MLTSGHGQKWIFSLRLFASDDPDGVDQPGKITQQRQQNIDPKLQSKTDLEEYPQGRNNYRKYESKAIHQRPFYSDVVIFSAARRILAESGRVIDQLWPSPSRMSQ